MLPQSVWAQTNNEAQINEGTMTITTNEAGKVSTNQVANMPTTPEQKAAITKIVLIGKFNESDLAAIKGNDGSGLPGAFTNVTEVDMADARFVITNSTPTQADYKLYASAFDVENPVSGTAGDRAIFGGTLYQSSPNVSWVLVNYAPNEGTNVAQLENTGSTNGYSVGSYGKVKKGVNNGFIYVQMQVTGESWSGPTTTAQSNASENPLTVSTTENDKLNEVLHDYYAGQCVWFWRYYTCVYDTDQSKWVWNTTYSSNESTWNSATASKYDNPSNVNLGALDDNYAGEGNVMRVKVYYVKQETSRNWTGDTSVQPTGVTIRELDGDYAYRNNHKNDIWGTVIKHGDWVRLIDYDYYQLQQNGWVWSSTNYVDGTSYNITKKYANEEAKTADTTMPTAANQYAIVGGTEKYYNGSLWVDPDDSSVSESAHYSDMKFTYWSGTLVKAVTSKYADNNISSDIFANCKILKDVVFNAGVLRGFQDHNATNNYNPEGGLKVTVGKDVTRIESFAFKGCDVLKTIEFDKNYSGLGNDSNYPKVLTIGSYAFLDCVNLTGISIPNRVSNIESSAFHYAGNNTSEFSLTFERRYYDDKTSQEGDYSEGKDFDVPLVIGDGAFEDCTKLKSLSLPVRLTTLGTRAFANSESLTTLVMREDTKHPLRDMTNGNAEYQSLQIIKSQTFSGSHVEEIVIPSSVTEIEGAAFQQTSYLKKITFQNTNTTPLIIRSGAFAGGREEGTPVLDIYVNVNPDSRKIVCEYDAFTYTQMEGQTNVGSHQFAKLHFDREYWDYYQGNWKRGLAFRQDNLNAFKDGYNGYYGGVEDQGSCVGKGTTLYTDLTHIENITGKYEKEGFTGDSKYIAPANGWQQFAGTSTDIDIIIPEGSFMRSYSTNTAYVIPTFTEEWSHDNITVRVGDPMFDIYRITAFNDQYHDGDDTGSNQTAQGKGVATATKVELTDFAGKKYIPSETGLIMVGKINADYVVYLADIAEGTNETTYPFNISTYSDISSPTNLLYPTCIENQNYDGTFTEDTPNQTDSKYLEGAPAVTTNSEGQSIVTLNSTVPYPYYDINELQFRIFGYSASQNKFVRTANAWCTRDKAYLKLTPTMFHWSNEYTPGSGSQSGVGQDPQAGARISDIFLDFDDESETTGIKQVETTTKRMESNAFYSLEGVRLNARPTQRGIYIQNGRKVVIK